MFQKLSHFPKEKASPFINWIQISVSLTKFIQPFPVFSRVIFQVDEYC
ncbi:hypothetical protein OIU77_012081 [Salix suchowensis]|uniref:Uncharacterized protein n=1 Tax=Salix suchowensis TaxID=1278906 RepID=A0ABQ9A2D9_9ROSI|nr:hypothetical protein OIU77_012081 [Salix suchowensis]